MKENEIKKMVREGYATIAQKSESCCGPVSSCCGSSAAVTVSEKLGYDGTQLADLPGDADMGLGCGAPTNYAHLRPGEIVMDLGSGGGIDCFLAAKAVGDGGRIIGVDMTPEMIDKARRNAAKGGFTNVEFRLGEIDHLPAGDNTVDVILSNCVINLAPDKGDVFREMFRVLKPGGHFTVADIVLNEPFPVGLQSSVKAYTGCISGAMLKDDYLKIIREAGFDRIELHSEQSFSYDVIQDDETAEVLLAQSEIPRETVDKIVARVESVTLSGYKP